MNKQTKTILALLGVGAVGAGIWYFTRPDTAQAANVPNGSSFIPGPTVPAGPAVPTGPASPAPVVYPVVMGINVKKGDNIYQSGSANMGIFSSPGVPTGWFFRPGDRVGEVIDTTPSGYLKVRKFTNAPAWDGVPHYEFYVSKYTNYTVR